MAEEVNKWEGVVNKMRKDEQVTFPLVDESVSIHQLDKQFKPRLRTQLERDMYELLNDAGLHKPKEVMKNYSNTTSEHAFECLISSFCQSTVAY